MNTNIAPVNWHCEDESLNLWICECGYEFQIDYGTPAENQIYFCPKCGNLIRIFDDTGESDG